MSGVATEQIAAGLRRRGVDARTFVDGDEPGGQGHRGVAVHGICVLGWRYPDGRWEFTDGPPSLIEPDEYDPSGRWIWDDILSDCCQSAAAVSDQVQVVVGRVAELLPADPNQPRSQCFADFWAWDAMCRDSAGAPDRWYREWCDHLCTELRPEAARAGYTPGRRAVGGSHGQSAGRCAVRRHGGVWVTGLSPRYRCSVALRHYWIGHLAFICAPTFPPGRRSGIPQIRSTCLPSSPRCINTWAGTTNGSTVSTGPIPAPHFNASNPNRVSKSPSAWDQTRAYWFSRPLPRCQRPITDGGQNFD